MDSRSDGDGGGAARAPRTAAAPQAAPGGGDLPNYEYSDADEEVPF
jgi:hypothetical protein